MTGAGAGRVVAVAAAVARARAAGLPIAVGFGIRSPEQAAAVARIADAVVVGSALVEIVEAAVGRDEDPVARRVRGGPGAGGRGPCRPRVGRAG